MYAIEQVPEEEIQAGNSQSDSMGDYIRENSDYDQDPIEELLVKYQKEIQDIQLEAGLTQFAADENLYKNTQYEKKLLVKPMK
ncbi:hypothetical protein O181_037466 [Austropuccinia psidii MF-1]|uniref:Uncharacterized protein n=1 Tax=Austropuccinia psidii MF-1 TaxID=1389203 RepID=A0A9Q3DC57_9BASI|nr:hypothetical protein [Austropuccinia psidii MF-1]